MRSLPAWGAWIEIPRSRPASLPSESLPAWGAWIEIPFGFRLVLIVPSLPAWGAWIEIIIIDNDSYEKTGRSPHGERGLKLKRC